MNIFLILGIVVATVFFLGYIFLMPEEPSEVDGEERKGVEQESEEVIAARVRHYQHTHHYVKYPPKEDYDYTEVSG